VTYVGLAQTTRRTTPSLVATSRIPAFDPALATGQVKQLLDGVQRGLGVTPNMFRVAAQSPATIEGLVSLFGAASKGHLSAKTREAIALTVSEIDACDYCLSAHSALGAGAGLSATDLDKARDATADDPRLAATLRFARTITERRGRVGDAGVGEARAGRAAFAGGALTPRSRSTDLAQAAERRTRSRH